MRSVFYKRIPNPGSNGNPADTAHNTVVVIAAGSGASAVSITIGSSNPFVITGNVSGTALTVPSQSVTVNSIPGSLSGGGTLSGNTLTAALTFLPTAGGTVTYTYTGSK